VQTHILLPSPTVKESAGSPKDLSNRSATMSSYAMTSKELANFDDHEGHIVGERTVAPHSYAVQDRLPHFWQWKLGRIQD